VFTFIQMLTVASMAVFAHNALGDGLVGFALSFVAYQLILTYLSWRTGVHDPTHHQQFRDQVNHVWSLSHSAVERFGLWTIIVLGEVVVGAVQGVAKHHHIDLEIGLTAAFGILIAIGMWWVYFDFVSHRLQRSGEKFAQGWMYFHLPMTMGIAASGAAVLNTVVFAGESISGEVRWLLVGATASTLIAVAILIRMIHVSVEFRPIYRTGEFMILASAIAILLLGFTNLKTIPLLFLLILLMLAPAFYGIKVWSVEFGDEEIKIDSEL
jgi:low temperature requirement protein LtrA